MSLDEKLNAENKNTDVNSRRILLHNCAVLGDICKWWARAPAAYGLFWTAGYFVSGIPDFYSSAQVGFTAGIICYSFGIVMKDGIYKNVSRWYEIQDKKNNDIQNLEQERKCL